jgi:hypothetical protein
MDAFIYCADIYCPACTAKIKAELEGAGTVPSNPDDESSYDSDEYPKGPFSDGGGESDSPQHCGECHVALGNDLTTAGVKYVLEALSEYPGSGDASVMDGWAEQLKDYSLDKDQRTTLEVYWALRAEAQDYK